MQGQSIPVPGNGRRLKRIELTGLEPGENYEFRFSGVGPVYRFRTMPAEPDRPIRFLAGGDMMHYSPWMWQTARSAMQVTGGDIDFDVIGGDLAYANGEDHSTIRDHWVPLFEEHGVRLAFEHHDHTYKRTHPIRDNQIDEDGIHYIGDGAWGCGPIHQESMSWAMDPGIWRNSTPSGILLWWRSKGMNIN